MKEMEDNRDNLTVIFAGYEERLPELFKVNPGFKTRVNRILRFADYSTTEMVQMFEMMAAKENGMKLTLEAREKLLRYIDSYAKRGGLGNGRGIRNLFDKTKGLRALRRAYGSQILPEDLPDPISFKKEEAEAVINGLEKDFIGLPRVKEFFRFRRDQDGGQDETRISAKPFEMDASYEQQLIKKREVFKEKNGTSQALKTIMVSAKGLSGKTYTSYISDVITLDDLFEG